MRFPVRINRNLLPTFLYNIVPSSFDTRRILNARPDMKSFEQSVTAINIDGVWRSTYKQRHPISNKLIQELISNFDKPVIHEPAISAGSTSLDLIRLLGDRFAHYYATDRFTKLPYQLAGNAVFFYHPVSKRPIFRVSDLVVMYEGVASAVFPLGHLATKYLREAPEFDLKDPHYVSMVSPDLMELVRETSRVSLTNYSLLDPWASEPIHLAKIANVLNSSYFSDESIVAMLANTNESLVSGGIIVLIDNKKIEKVSVLVKEKTGKLVIQQEVNGGAYAAQLAQRVRPSQVAKVTTVATQI